MRAYERLINYCAFDTTSVIHSDTVPSSGGQLELAKYLARELTALGLSGVYTDKHAYVYGYIPASAGYESVPCVGFLSHLDTVAFGTNKTRPRVVRSYDGGVIPLGESGLVLDPKEHPKLRDAVGKTLVVTDGTSVLGGDDKAGIAEIVTLCEELLSSDAPHGRIAVAFSPDEEIGHGAKLLDLDRFGAAFAYTLDECDPSELVGETFNAAMAEWEIRGVSVHTGTAKGLMINAGQIAAEIACMLPPDEIPAETDGREGFFHLDCIEGKVESAFARFILRDFEDGAFENRKSLMRDIERRVNEKYGAGTAKLTLTEQYRNMARVLDRNPEIMETARRAVREVGLSPSDRAMRGGTDGAQLSFRGLPCPNLGTGDYNFHSPYEFAVAEEMDTVVAILRRIVAICAGM